jgi:hemolysin III
MQTSSSYTAAPDEPESLDPTWSFADTGKTRPLSRDLSPHSTDEVFNSVSHLSGAMLSLLGTTLLVSGASARGDVWKVVAFSIYGACLVGMFVCSVLHHSISSSEEVRNSVFMIYVVLRIAQVHNILILCLHIKNRLFA